MSGTPPVAAPAASAPRWLSFRIAGQAYAVPLASVVEVIRDAEVTPVPGSAPELRGICQLRGQVVPVLDGCRRFGLPSSSAAGAGQAHIVVLAHGAHLAGLRVDAVGELLEAGDEAMPPPPGRPPRDDDPVEGVLPLQAGFVALLDVGRLCRLPAGKPAA